uniref:Zinc finger protein 532 n=1 Tax=Neogobius melanostomus TaxID=47308 RepID=A0A8C6T7S1_9GOBI
MGDMRTLDFDDLLAAFDIPDMVDPKPVFESVQVDHEGRLRITQDEPQSTQDVGFCVIVKNTRNKDNKGHLDSHTHFKGNRNGHHDGCLSTVPSVNNDHNKAKRRHSNDSGPMAPMNTSQVLYKYNPISSAEEFEDEEIHVDIKERPLDQNNNGPVDVDFPIVSKDVTQQEELKDSVPERQELSKTNEPSKPDKLPSCTAAITALSAKQASIENYGTDDSLQSKNEPLLVSSQEDDSCATPKRIDISEPSQSMLLTKLQDSPSSTTSDSSSKRLPASVTEDTIPVIPKVHIKTIKTKTGQIKHTLTRIPSEGITNNQGFREAKCAIFTSPRHTVPTTEAEIAAEFVNEVTKQMTMKPVATAFLPASAVKTAGSQFINLKLANNTTVKATVIPASSIHSTNGAILKAANAIQQQGVMVPTSNLLNTKMPKNVHLGNLNLFQQTMAPPALSKVQVFESSQNSVVDAFNKVLSSINPVPIYVPDLSPPSSACITLPSHGYKCLECGDSFALERSLAQHYGRRSVRIDVTCNQCTKSLVFYNKCSLLSHARSHKDKGMLMQCSHLILKPIPADQMVITTCPASVHRTNSTSNCQTSCNGPQHMLCTLMTEDERSKVDEQNLICWECNEMFQDVSSLSVHYQQESNGQKTCSACQMVLPNQCSFLSHQRFHKHKSPFICPECGADCQSAHDQLHHVTKTCLHYTRRNGYRCGHCSVILTDASTLKSHIQSTHCEIFYKCSICPMAFKSAPGTHSHSYAQHPGVKAGEPKLIYKCAMCDTVFTLQSLLYTHLEQHVSTHRVPVFKCPDCSIFYTQKQLMLDHIKTTHGNLKTVEGPSNLGISLPLCTRSINSNSTCSNPNNIKDSGNENCHIREFKGTLGYTCRGCNTDFLCRETYVGHMKKEHGKIIKKHPCHHCEKSFCSVHSLCRHKRLKHKKWYCYCYKKYFLHLNCLSLKCFYLQTSTKRKTEHNKTSAAENCKSPDSQPLKKLKVNIPKVQKCAVCGFNTENITIFHEHIPQHKSNGSSYQCKECGLCYTSPRSLSRHLFIVHRLKEPHVHGHRHVIGSDESQRENQLHNADENEDGAPNTRCKVYAHSFNAANVH